ncbi:HAD family hydrolase [Prochlorococcus marinus XMU1414]|uniref:HAD family hydrolase n=1 Tax=Prochlorococcus marinus XMU1424 TaxID=2774497 RepID=A0A9D9BYK8_PROMR|nr:HAD family hydrolase [Prochlorococcus marinus]MBO8228679.1 HAD family hydrolase [Prochlorococcus marinus XMU1414]MBW3046158.1 HAD family hydrolase [Prochlorococcus marinus str. MU1414]MCR8531550.1 HAD hydrolase-like protein [Prochlorococcus marinus XMU1420]MCR8535279.1 HAD hydrolase-like protein [Prochlorococcus marinus XMU1424]
MNLKKYKTIVFDCDGVILDSNKIKTDAFRLATKNFGKEFSERLVNYHIKNGGVSRYKKFDYFIEKILDFDMDSNNKINKDILKKNLLENYSSFVVQELMTCKVAPKLKELKDSIPLSDWVVISGSDQNELRKVFENRNISHFFNLGIYGSPKDKYENINYLYSKIKTPALFIGDSKLDHLVASHFSMDFVFLSDWSEFSDLKSYAKKYKIPVKRNLSYLLEYLI